MRTLVYRFALAIIASLSLLCGGLPPATASAAPTGLAGEQLSPETRQELARLRQATARYHDLSQAVADGYVDIDVFVSGQGFHYLKPSLLDGTFEVEKPELLVYAPNPQGVLRLVAVEYAVPVSLSATAPAGFTGDDDVWHVEPDFGLWVLHAWVWLNNPNGMFADFNPRVP